jgi:RNA polymerase sigma-70 factor (ECF subfamily)
MMQAPRVSSSDPVAADLRQPPTFQAFYRQALPVVYGYFLGRCGGRAATAEDLTQETFTAAVSEIRKGTVMEGPLPWVMGIARHKLIDHFRRESRAQRKLALVYEAQVIDDDDPWAISASRDQVIGALALVPASQRAVLVLRYLDGMSVPEVARVIARSVHATESLLARGRESFKRALQEPSHA